MSEPEKPSAEEQPSGLPLFQQVWNEAYDSIEENEPGLVKSYVKTITVSLQPQEAPDASTPDVSPELKDPIKRQEAMKILVQEGREKVATTISQGVGYIADSVLKAKGRKCFGFLRITRRCHGLPPAIFLSLQTRLIERQF